jgi:hypothetical protein
VSEDYSACGSGVCASVQEMRTQLLMQMDNEGAVHESLRLLHALI